MYTTCDTTEPVNNSQSHSIAQCKQGNPLQRSPLLSWVSQDEVRVQINLTIAVHSYKTQIGPGG